MAEENQDNALIRTLREQVDKANEEAKQARKQNEELTTNFTKLNEELAILKNGQLSDAERLANEVKEARKQAEEAKKQLEEASTYKTKLEKLEEEKKKEYETILKSFPEDKQTYAKLLTTDSDPTNALVKIKAYAESLNIKPVTSFGKPPESLPSQEVKTPQNNNEDLASSFKELQKSGWGPGLRTIEELKKTASGVLK